MLTQNRAAFFINKIYDNFNFDKMFLVSRHVQLSEKSKYLYRKYYALIAKKSEIAFLGRNFRYDNPYTPILLQGYPSEIEALDNAIQLKNIKSALDIGANIG
jgi:hypothetical protein